MTREKNEHRNIHTFTITLEMDVFSKLLEIQMDRRLKREKHFFNAIISDLIIEKYDLKNKPKKQEAE